MSSKPSGVRARARADFIEQIKAEALSQLRTAGADSLSLRAVARELDVASSALYRYFPSRDDLLTALILDAYGDIADVADSSVATSAGEPFRVRWLGLACAIRDWAVGHTHEYALIYGSPVPGYAAPPETSEPAQRLTLAFLTVLADAAAEDELGQVDFAAPSATSESFAIIRSLASAAVTARPDASAQLTDGRLRAGVGLWTQLFGHLSFEMFGQFQNVVSDPDEFFNVQMSGAAERLVARSSTVRGAG